jgi:mannose-6-phosphate isomerase-like protein (cupin superfamily)
MPFGTTDGHCLESGQKEKIMRIVIPAVALASLTVCPLQLSAQETGATRQPPALTMVWAPKPDASPFVAPNRPHWKLSEILAAHRSQKNWSEPIVRDPGGLSATYIQMAPGEKTKTMLFADTSIFWVVETGQIRFTIQGQEPFVASHNFIVSVPARTAFSLETVGDAPSLRFEVSHTRSTPLYPVGETPTPVKGKTYLREAITGGPVAYGAGVKPYVDFEKEVVDSGGRPPPGFAHDSETAANIIRGPGVPRPPDSDPGHFHDGSAEFFFVLDGHLSLLTEGVPFIAAAEPGDVLYAPAGRWHRTAFTGDGMSARISIHGVASSLNILDPEHSAQAQ